MQSQSELYIGLMSGTSLDGVDGVLVDFSANGCQVLQHVALPLSPGLRSELLQLNTSGADELHRAALAANALARTYAKAVAELLERSQMPASAVAAIGAHGQTVRHRPGAFDGTGYTLQLNSPALLAERTGIAVVADFRSRDVAAGGQGAPLVPAFHQHLFARPGETVLVLNLGGMANLSVLGADGEVLGFDCGPGNVLLDGWCQRHTGQSFDADGAWGALGTAIPELLATMLAEPYLHQAPPKSTGRDLFHADWLARHLSACLEAAPQDVQATLVELTASACAQSASSYGKNSKKMVVCGGGVLNAQLMQRLRALLPDAEVSASDAWGLPAQQVEATAFAWLARQTVRGAKGSLKNVTGACGARVLGAIYPA